MAGVVFLLPQIIHALPAPCNIQVGKYTLDLAAQQMIAQHPAPGYFGAGPSALIVAAYAAAGLTAAALPITRRDPPRGSRRALGDPAQIALALVIRHPAVAAIPGASSVEQLERNAAAADIDLTDGRYQALSAAAARFRPIIGPAAIPRLARARLGH